MPKPVLVTGATGSVGAALVPELLRRGQRTGARARNPAAAVLPVMVCPRLIDTRTQPIASRDVVAALASTAEHEQPPEGLQLGGADVLTYREMMARIAAVLGRRRPRVVKVPVLTPRLSSCAVALVTPVETGLARPLIDGLGTEMIVTEPLPAGIDDRPLGFDAAVRAAME